MAIICKLRGKEFSKNNGAIMGQKNIFKGIFPLMVNINFVLWLAESLLFKINVSFKCTPFPLRLDLTFINIFILRKLVKKYTCNKNL